MNDTLNPIPPDEPPAQPPPADAGGTPPVTAPQDQDFAALLDHYDQAEVRDGEVVPGRILKIEKDWVLVDIGYKSEGRIPIHEFQDAEGNLTVKEGDETSVYVESRENAEGLLELSKEKAEKLKIWDEIAAAHKRDGVVEGTVLSRVKGGLTVDIGVRAFLPGSQIDLRPARDLDRYLGQTYRFKVIKFNRRRGNIVLSRRMLLEKEREELKSRTLATLQVGQVLEGTVMNITEYGAFVDLGGIDGLLHITDMSWGRINHPSEMVRVGDRVKVKVLKFDPATERVSLGMKQTGEDPWLRAEERYHVDDRIRGRVVSLADYGAFVELEPGVEGLIHVSEMSWTKKVKHPSKVLNVGDEVEAVVLQVDARNKRIALGLKQTEINPWQLLAEKYPVGTRVRGRVRSITSFGVFVGIEEGIDGLVHLQDISWSRKAKNPAEMFQKGDEVEAVVLHIDPDKERFALGIKQLQEDPWERVHERYPIGSIVKGKVTKILDFGAIIELEDEVEGLVHVSEIRPEKVESVGKVLKAGEEVTAMVINLIPEDRKLGLSIRRYLEAEESGDYAEYLKTQHVAPTTIGDLIREKIDVSSLPKGPADRKDREAPEPAAEAEAEAPEAEAAPEAPATKAPARKTSTRKTSARKAAPAEAEAPGASEAPAEAEAPDSSEAPADAPAATEPTPEG